MNSHSNVCSLLWHIKCFFFLCRITIKLFLYDFSKRNVEWKSGSGSDSRHRFYGRFVLFSFLLYVRGKLYIEKRFELLLYFVGNLISQSSVINSISYFVFSSNCVFFNVQRIIMFWIKFILKCIKPLQCNWL